MSRIRVLPESVANRIAAGEVVERPASVLKELVENSLDAGSTSISISIKNAGKSLIQVIDNGFGMSKEDIFLAFERHATSKITQFEDLENLSTLGFRGEALPSIASVSRVEVRTKLTDEENGWAVAFEAGKVVRVEPVVMGKGTNFAVKNLFYNVPARRRFLKSNPTETSHIVNRFKKFAISNPNVEWTFTNDDELVYQLSSGSLEQRIEQLYSKSIFNDLRPVTFDSEGIVLTGFIGNANLLRSQRGEQHLFLNRRVIRSPLITSGVLAGLGQIAQPHLYPFYILFLETSPRNFDINVHPSKEEVKFDNEPLMRKIVIDSIRDGLRTGGKEEPTHSFTSREFHGDFQKKVSSSSPIPTDEFAKHSPRIFEQPQGYVPKNYRGSDNQLTKQTQLFRPQFSETESTLTFDSAKEILQGIEINLTQYWQIQGKYIFLSVPSGVVIIDQHVAHERILYEKALKMLKDSAGESQTLLFPLKFTVQYEDVLTATELKEDLKRIGFQIEIPDASTIELRSVPRGIVLDDEEKVLLQMLDLYRKEFSARPDQEDHLAATYACKAAIKAGTPLSPIEMKQLIEDLFTCDLPYVCPHGRPILIQLSYDELDRRFGRTGG